MAFFLEHWLFSTQTQLFKIKITELREYISQLGFNYVYFNSLYNVKLVNAIFIQ